MVRRRRAYRRRVYRRTGGGLAEEVKRPPRPTQPPTIVRGAPCQGTTARVRRPHLLTAGMYRRRRRRTTRRRFY